MSVKQGMSVMQGMSVKQGMSVAGVDGAGSGCCRAWAWGGV